MADLHLFFSHRLTPEQQQDAYDSLGIREIYYLSPSLQQQWSQVPAEIQSLREWSRPFENYLDEVAKKGDFVLIQGDFGLTYLLVQAALDRGMRPVYATTKRSSVERSLPDGEVRREHVFRHIRFRSYEALG